MSTDIDTWSKLSRSCKYNLWTTTLGKNLQNVTNHIIRRVRLCLPVFYLILLFSFSETVEEEAAPVEEGYSYPVPENPLELPEKSSHSELPDDAVAPLALYGAPAQPFELPPGRYINGQYATLCLWL